MDRQLLVRHTSVATVRSCKNPQLGMNPLELSIDASFQVHVGLGILGDHRNAQRAPRPLIAGNGGGWIGLIPSHSGY